MATKTTRRRDGSGRGNWKEMEMIKTSKTIIVSALLLVGAGCVSNVQDMKDCTVYVSGEGAGAPIVVVGAQVAAKPVDLGILNPATTATATAAASKEGNAEVNQAKTEVKDKADVEDKVDAENEATLADKEADSETDDSNTKKEAK